MSGAAVLHRGQSGMTIADRVDNLPTGEPKETNRCCSRGRHRPRGHRSGRERYSSLRRAVNVIVGSGADVELTHFDWSANRYLADGVTVPPEGFAMLERDFDAILLG